MLTTTTVTRSIKAQSAAATIKKCDAVRQVDAKGTPIPAYDWTQITITREMQEAADKIYANSAARRPMLAR